MDAIFVALIAACGALTVLLIYAFEHLRSRP